MTRAALTLFVLAAAVAPAAAGDSLAQSLYKQADVALRKLQGNPKMTAVGVLKFTAEGKNADQLNELGSTLAVRTQMALVLRNKNPAFVIIENPNRQVVAAPVPGANHLTEPGRKAFFGIEYTPSFGERKVHASGFVVGTAKLSGDLKTLSLKLQVFDATGKLEDLVDPWQVDTDAELLGQIGKGYTLTDEQQKAVAAGKTLPKEEVQKQAAKAAAETAKAEPPAKLKAKGEPAAIKIAPTPNTALDTCPVKWVVRYNTIDQPVSGGLLPEPAETDKVTFHLRNTSKTEQYGVVLLVNGENTLYKERQAVAKCRKWILDPGGEAVVTGFQTGPNEAAEFEVVRPENPRVDSVRYSENLGLFRMVVFAGKETDEEPKADDGEVLDPVQVVANARLNDRPGGLRPESLDRLQAKLTLNELSQKSSRMVVVGGKGVPAKTKQVSFTLASEQPVADITLRYFHPKK